MVLEADDLKAASTVLSRSYRSMRIDARGPRGGMRLVRASVGPVQLDHVSFAMDFDAAADPPEGLVFGQLAAGRLSYGSENGARSYQPGQVFHDAPASPCTVAIRGAEINAAIIPAQFAADTAATEPGRAPRPLRFTGCEPVSPQAAANWQSAYSYIWRLTRNLPDAASHPLVTGNAARLLTAVALSTFPNNALTEPTVEDRHDAHPPTLRRAMAFIDEHAHEDISMADVAAACSVTIRTIQLAFRRHMETTPLKYLRRVRLHHAHRDLLAADPARDSVTAVAYRWGFASPSRFARYYRQAYGIPPGRTLRS